MEDQDLTRVELNEQELEDVVGGAFSFYNNKRGEPRVNVYGLGVYACKDDAFTTYINIYSANQGASDAEILVLLQEAGAVDLNRLD